MLKYYLSSLFTIGFLALCNAQGCYTKLLEKGKIAYNNGQYDTAIEKWEGAKDCPDADYYKKKTLEDWINKAKEAKKPKPQDSDNDGWSDNNDDCPDTSGTLRGCPDSDGDGIADKNDKCPNEKGDLANNGCKKTKGADFEEIVGNSTFKMVFVEGGTFTMGCTSEQQGCDSDEKPTHSVTLSDYYIGRYEVTQKQWYAIMGTKPSYFKDCDDCPVEQVSWDDIQEFLQKLNQKTGRAYRLPTEAEWEYAARGGNKSQGYQYAGSNIIDEVAWYWVNSNNKTHSDTKKANELGIFNMSGNVWEWCNDWKGEYGSSSQTNPTGPSTGTYRVLRGGSWFISSSYCRVAVRHFNFPTFRYLNFGFRLCLRY